MPDPNVPVVLAAVPPVPWYKTEWVVAGPNVVLLAFFVYLCVGALTEISSRLSDYKGLQTYLAALEVCGASQDPAKLKPGCDGKDANQNKTETAQDQLRNYDRLNARGSSGDRCGVAAVIVSPYGGFRQDCAVLNQRMTVADAKARAKGEPINHADPSLLPKGPTSGDRDVAETTRGELEPILYPPFATYSWFGFDFDSRPKEDLFFLFIILSAGVGSLVAGLRSSGFTTVKDVAVGCALGFAVYLLIKGGHMVFFTGSSTTATGPVVNDNLNPFSAALAGFLVGLFKDQAIGLFGGVFAEASKIPPEKKPGA
jgi:hypothetical protein